MKHQNITIIILSLAIGMGACIYADSGIYTVDPVPGEKATVSVTTNMDTLVDPVLSDSLQVIYDFEIDNGELYYVESILEETRVYELLLNYDPDTIEGPFGLTDTFWIHRSVPVDSGLHSLSLRFYYSSNTNTMADLFRVEADELERAYPITVEGGVK
ncbi:MAG: hypothetical protein ABFS10_04760 [Bacteroidota bacterium]